MANKSELMVRFAEFMGELATLIAESRKLTAKEGPHVQFWSFWWLEPVK